MNLREAFEAVMAKTDLSEDEAFSAMSELMGGTAPPELVAGFVVALRLKPESISEITGFARAMRERAIRIRPKVRGRLVDTCGTGGAAVKSFNISTTAAFVAAAAGVPVAKHGNRSVTRPSGSADVLAALGAEIQLAPERVEAIIEQVGIGFLLAPAFHPAMKNAASTRQALRIRTVFNLLGPLTNPAHAKGQVLGVYDPRYVRPLAEVLLRLGSEHALVVHGSGMDEATLAGPTAMAEVRNGVVTERTITGAEFGFPLYAASAWAPLSPVDSAAEVRRILSGKANGGRRDVVALNAGLAVYVGGRAASIADGITRARQVLDSGAGLTKLDEFVAATRSREVFSA